MDNFIDYVVKYQASTESPDDYWKWSAIACIGALMRNQVYYETQIGKVYPNIYVIILAKSGVTRKAAAPKFIGKLIQECGNTKFINGRASMQAVVRELGATYSSPTGHTISGASGILYTEELSAFLVQDPASIPLLIDLYDYHETWQTNLISGSIKLKEVCVSMLAASNFDLLKLVFSDVAIKGGLLGRTFFVTANKAKHRKSLLDLQMSEMSIEPLVKHLKRINLLQGKIGTTTDSKDYYNDWYYSVPDEILGDQQGFGSRIGTHVLKIAMIVAASRHDFKMLIEVQDFERAVRLCMPFVKAYKQMLAGVGASENSKSMALLLKLILEAPRMAIAHSTLMEKAYADFKDSAQVEALVLMLVQGGLITTIGIFIGNENVPGYELSEKGKLVLGVT